MRFYILKGHTPVRATQEEWSHQIAKAPHPVVAYDQYNHVDISTIFLGIDHNFFGEGPPILFETMIFGGELNEYQVRYCTWDEAVEGHKAALQLVVISENNKQKC
jgi:hypothetical protein